MVPPTQEPPSRLNTSPPPRTPLTLNEKIEAERLLNIGYTRLILKALVSDACDVCK